MAGLTLCGAGLLLLWCAWTLDHRSKRSAFLKTLGCAAAAPSRRRAGESGPGAISPPGARVKVGLAAGYGLVVGMPELVQGDPPLATMLITAALAGAALPAAWVRVAGMQRRAAMDRAAGDLIGHLRLQSAAGTSLLSALHSAPGVVREPLRRELEQLLADAQVSPLPAALDRFMRRCADRKIENLVHHLLHQQALGVPLERILLEEEQHYLALAQEEARQRIRSATLVMAVITFVLFINGALLFAVPLAIRAFSFLAE